MIFQDKISIIIPVYNTKQYLERCFNSIQTQTYSKLELLSIDDGSLDNSARIIDEKALQDNRFICIHKNNAGLSEARNDGIKLSSGNFVAFVDSDDYILPNMYRDMIECKKQTNCDIIVCQWQWEDKNGKWTVKHNDLDKNIYGYKSGIEMEKLNTQGGYYECLSCVVWNKLYPFEVFNCTLFDGRKAEDCRFNDFLFSRKFDYYIMNNYYYIYCESPISVTRGIKHSMNDLLFLDVLIKRNELFKNDSFIAKHTTRLYCDIFIETFIMAKSTGFIVPNNYCIKYKEFWKKDFKKSNIKRKIRLLCFAIMPNVSSNIYILRRKLC